MYWNNPYWVPACQVGMSEIGDDIVVAGTVSCRVNVKYQKARLREKVALWVITA
jgi:hypothetical protein